MADCFLDVDAEKSRNRYLCFCGTGHYRILSSDSLSNEDFEAANAVDEAESGMHIDWSNYSE